MFVERSFLGGSKTVSSDTREVEEVYQSFSGAIFALYRRLGYSIEECEDLTQEVFVRIQKNIRTFRGEGLAGWVMTIARNLHRETVRRQDAIRRAHRPLPLDDADGIGVEPQQQRSAEKAERRRWLREKINGLPAEERQCLWLASFQGYTYGEMAELIGVSENSVRERLRKARRSLRANAARRS